MKNSKPYKLVRIDRRKYGRTYTYPVGAVVTLGKKTTKKLGFGLKPRYAQIVRRTPNCTLVVPSDANGLSVTDQSKPNIQPEQISCISITGFVLEHGEEVPFEAGWRGLRVPAYPILTLPDTTPTAADLAEPPKRIKTTAYRIIRDTPLGKEIKRQHRYRCQICGKTIKLSDGSNYAEAHHLQPLGKPHGGPDIEENIVCLCPNHHAACDLGAIELVRRKLRQSDTHRVGEKFLTYHNKMIWRALSDI